MFEPWILITLAAAGMQNIRSILQKNLTARYTVAGVTYARFLFGFPLSIVFVLLAGRYFGVALPDPNGPFFFYAVVGGVTQILGNLVFINLINFANFTISTTYSKTETVLAALFSFVLLGDALSFMGLGGVLLTFVGVLVIAAGRERITMRSLAFAITDKAALYGLAVGALYAVASTSYRAGTLSLGADNLILHAFYMLAWVSFFQCLLMGILLAAKSPTVLHAIFRNWRSSMWLGVTGMTASVGWYVAFAMQKIAYVLAVGQLELILAYIASRFMFKEHAKAAEIGGVLLTMAGILVVVFAR